MRVEHVKHTTIAYAPDELVRVQRKYGIDARLNSDRKLVDIIHFHNRVSFTDRPHIVQYHSEPCFVDMKVECPKVVIAQSHSLMPCYEGLRTVRNVIDLYGEQYQQREAKGIRVAFSPSAIRKYSVLGDKGYEQTVDILKRVRRIRPGFKFDIITGVPLEECIERKSKCNIVVDECITGCFHRSALEGLGLGKMVICSIDRPTKDVLMKTSGAPYCPFENIGIDDLEYFLLTVSEDRVIEAGRRNRQWAEAYWNPEDIVKEYKTIYERTIDEHNSRDRDKPQRGY